MNTKTYSGFLVSSESISTERGGCRMARSEHRVESRGVDRQSLLWAVGWTAVNVGIIAMIMLLASAA
jgi:hypothetical protein